MPRTPRKIELLDLYVNDKRHENDPELKLFRLKLLSDCNNIGFIGNTTGYSTTLLRRAESEGFIAYHDNKALLVGYLVGKTPSNVNHYKGIINLIKEAKDKLGGFIDVVAVIGVEEELFNDYAEIVRKRKLRNIKVNRKKKVERARRIRLDLAPEEDCVIRKLTAQEEIEINKMPTIPCLGKKEWRLPPSYYMQMKETYPDINMVSVMHAIDSHVRTGVRNKSPLSAMRRVFSDFVQKEIKKHQKPLQ